MTPEQATALARFIHTVRPEWDEPGIFSALGHAKQADPLNAAMAAIRWTASPDTKTPGGMGRQGPHWTETVAAPTSPRPPKPDEACHFCGRHVDACLGDGHVTTTRPAAADRAPVTAAWRATRNQLRGATA